MKQITPSSATITPPSDMTQVSKPESWHGATMRLNVFQQIMRSWTTFCPYNAGQAMRLAGQPDVDRWQRAINAAISTIGLGRPEVQGLCAAFKASAPAIPCISMKNLEMLAAEQLNTPFRPGEIPMRFFVIPDGHDYWLLTIYDHWIADSYTIREFMRLIFSIYTDMPKISGHDIAFNDMPFEQLFGRSSGISAGLDSVLRAARRYFTHRRSWRFDLTDPMDFSAGLSMHVLPEGIIADLTAWARAHTCSVNDIFIGALALAMGQFTAQRRYKQRRRWWAGSRNCVSIGSIVNIRPFATSPLNHTFGMYLSSCLNTFSKPEQRSLSELICRTSRQTRNFKRRGGAIKAFGEFAVVRYFTELYSQPRHKALFFQKNCPLLAGVSNVNLTGGWMERPAGAQGVIQDYIRISPVGPLLPAVFALTTFKSRLHLCFTWRKAALTDAQAAELCTLFIAKLRELKT